MKKSKSFLLLFCLFAITIVINFADEPDIGDLKSLPPIHNVLTIVTAK